MQNSIESYPVNMNMTYMGAPNYTTDNCYNGYYVDSGIPMVYCQYGAGLAPPPVPSNVTLVGPPAQVPQMYAPPPTPQPQSLYASPQLAQPVPYSFATYIPNGSTCMYNGPPPVGQIAGSGTPYGGIFVAQQNVQTQLGCNQIPVTSSLEQPPMPMAGEFVPAGPNYPSKPVGGDYQIFNNYTPYNANDYHNNSAYCNFRLSSNNGKNSTRGTRSKGYKMNANYRTKACINFLNGYCRYGDNCQFLHTYCDKNAAMNGYEIKTKNFKNRDDKVSEITQSMMVSRLYSSTPVSLIAQNNSKVSNSNSGGNNANGKVSYRQDLSAGYKRPAIIDGPHVPIQ